ncbi:MAG: hypothetical protein LBJ24_03680 [Treponema sp.]|jgi:NAD(P)-dependent dehydrogenase (short-subunit alcohol dehydrogenase family)|nr:hypothetical protein [Treponema sp.]
MTRGILIAGNESSLFAAIAAEAARRAAHFVAALIPNRISEPVPEPAEGARIPLSWNPGNPVSARALALAAENRLEHVDEAVLICAPPSVRKKAEDLIPGELEVLVNDHIKGWFFLVRELALIFKEQRRGTLSLVLSDIGAGGKDETVDLLGPSAAASFRALAQGLLTGSPGEPYQVLAFSSSEIGEDASFASFIFKTMEEDNRRNSGKWHKYGRLGLFGR